LEDVEQCIAWLDSEDDEFRFRMGLIAAVALVRAVGHVLKKVDGARDSTLTEVIDARFAAWKADRVYARIFWDFIESERNYVLKQYELRFQFSPMVTTPEADHAWRLGSAIYCPLTEGAYCGEHACDVLREAVAWWSREMDLIDTEYRARLVAG